MQLGSWIPEGFIDLGSKGTKAKKEILTRLLTNVAEKKTMEQKDTYVLILELIKVLELEKTPSVMTLAVKCIVVVATASTRASFSEHSPKLLSLLFPKLGDNDKFVRDAVTQSVEAVFHHVSRK